jgi:hypothetical protein
MTKSKVIDILKTFNTVELKGFRDFIHSPVHNRNKKVRILFEIIKKHSPEYEDEKLKKENLYNILYPGKTYNDVVMRILISDLLKLSEEFLAYINYRKRGINIKKCLLEELKERKLDTLFRRNFKQAEELLLDDSTIDFKHFNELQVLYSLKIDFLISRDKQTEIAEDVLKQGEYMIYFSLSSLLNTVHELLQHEEILNINFENNIVKKFFDNLNLDEIYKYIGNSSSEYAGIAMVYYYMYKAYLFTNDDKYFFKLKECIEKHFYRFNREEKFNLLIIMESICSNKIGYGKTDFYNYLMEIYELMISESIWGHSKTSYIQINLFRNIFYTAVILERFDWATDFVDTYKNRLIPEQRENMVSFSNALILFEKREFENALIQINKVNYNFFVFKFDARVLLLKIYFELNLQEQVYSMIDSFSHFLSNNKNILKHDKERFGKFLKYMKLIMKIKTASNGNDYKSLELQLKNDTSVIAKKWIQEKLNLFEK